MKKIFTSEELEKICNAAIKVVKEVGAFQIKEAKGFDISKIEYKGENDLVSYVDKQSEIKLVKGLKEVLAEADFITEESTVEQNENAELRWIIDPLDGTTNFLHGLTIFSISVALIQGEELLVGVVYESNLQECFYAWKNGGAYCNGQRINVSQIQELKKSLIATGFPYSLLNKEQNYFKIMQEFVAKTHGVRRLGSAAVDLSYVACGRFEAYYEFNLKIWDIAAGILIVQEAGGKVTDFEGGNDYLYGKELIAGGKAHDQVLKVIKENW